MYLYNLLWYESHHVYIYGRDKRTNIHMALQMYRSWRWEEDFYVRMTVFVYKRLAEQQNEIEVRFSLSLSLYWQSSTQSYNVVNIDWQDHKQLNSLLETTKYQLPNSKRKSVEKTSTTFPGRV